MPALSLTARWRTHPQSARGHLYISHPASVFTALVNQASFSYPLDEVTYDGVTKGSHADIQDGMLVYFGSAAGGHDLGVTRIRATDSDANGADASKLYIGRSSNGLNRGELNLANDCYITVFPDYRPFAKIPYIDPADGTQYKDSDRVISTHGTQPPPVANAGPWRAKESSGGTATFDFDGTASFPVASGASLTTYAWDFGDGTPASSASSTVSGVSFPEGERWISLTVTDDNGETHTARALVVVEDPNSPTISKFKVRSDVLDQRGHRMAFQLLEDVDVSTFPEGAAVIYWEDERYGGVQKSLAGYSDAEAVKFCGWITSEPQRIFTELELGRIREQDIACVDIAGMLELLPGFSQVVERNASADAWTELAALNMDRFMWYLLYWHSTALEVSDFVWSGTGETYLFPRLQADGGSLYEQVAGRAGAMAHNFGCDIRGRMITEPDPMLQASADRTSVEIVDLDESDWTTLMVTHDRVPRSHWLRGAALRADSATFLPLFCIAPGSAPGQGLSERDTNYQIVADQDELNTREGNRYARENAPEGLWDLTLAHSGDAGFDPALMEWVQLSVPSTVAAQRGLTVTNERFLVHSVDTQHLDNGARIRSLRLEREIEGVAAVTVIPDLGDAPGLADYTFYWGTIPRFDPPTGLVELEPGLGEIAAFNGDGYIYICSDFYEDNPVWTRRTMDPDTVWDPAEVFLRMEVDPGSPFNLGTGPEANAWYITNYAIYYVTDVGDKGSGFDVAQQYVFNVVKTLRTIHCQQSTGGKCAVASFYKNDGTYPGTWVAYTDDRGATWTEVQVTAHYGSTGAFQNPPGIHYGWKGGDIVFTTGYSASGAGLQPMVLYKSTDGGANWAAEKTIASVDGLAFHIHAPIDQAGNPDDAVVYLGVTGSSSHLYIYKYDADADTVTDVAPLINSGIGQKDHGIRFGGRWSIHSYPYDMLKMVAVVTEAGNDPNVVVTTVVGGGNGVGDWTIKQNNAQNTGYIFAGISGTDPDVGYLCGYSGAVGYTEDFFTTVQDKSGNIPTDFPGVGTFHFLMGI